MIKLVSSILVAASLYLPNVAVASGEILAGDYEAQSDACKLHVAVDTSKITITKFGSNACTEVQSFTCSRGECRTDSGQVLAISTSTSLVWDNAKYWRDLDAQWHALNTTLTNCENSIRKAYAQRAFGSVACTPYADSANAAAVYYNSVQDGDTPYAANGYDSRHFPMERLQFDLDACHDAGNKVGALFSCIADADEQAAINETNAQQAPPYIGTASPGTTYTTNNGVTFGSNGVNYTTSGSITFGSDGTTYTTSGNMTFGSNGTNYTTVGNVTYGSNGTTYTTVGNVTFGSNGTTCITSGSMTSCN